MRRFDYNFLNNYSIPGRFLNYVMSISSLKTASEIRKPDFIEIYNKLEQVTIFQSVKHSNAIEGIIVKDKIINEIISSSHEPQNEDENTILGYLDALNYIHENHQNLSINESLILHLHEMLMHYTTIDSKGQYKTSDNVILEIDQFGNRSIRFKPIAASETSKAMEQLILAYMDAQSDSSINQLLLIPCFILDFLCIHPFQDGNGRMSRLLTILLLYKSGFDVVKYISFEQQINLNKGDYYKSLKESSYNWDENNNDYIPYMENFIFTLYRCYHELDQRFNVVHSNKVNKQTRIKETVLNSLIPISKQEISSILLDVSITTIEKVLGELKRDGIITTIGSGRNTKYMKIRNY